MSATIEDFNHLIKDGYKAKTSEWYQGGLNLVKKNFWKFLGFFIVAAIIYVVTFFIYGYIIGMVQPHYIITMILGLGIMYLFAILLQGIYVYLDRGVKNEGKFVFGDFFGGFKYIKQLSLYFLMMLVFSIPIMIIMVLLGFPIEIYTDPQALVQMIQDGSVMWLLQKAGLAYLVGMLMYTYLYISYIYAVPLIVGRDMNFWQAMETSRRVAGKKFFLIFGFFFILSIVLVVALLIISLVVGFIIGLFSNISPYISMILMFVFMVLLYNFLFGFMFGTLYSMYNSVFGVQDDVIKDKIDAFGSAEEDKNLETD